MKYEMNIDNYRKNQPIPYNLKDTYMIDISPATPDDEEELVL